MKPKNTKDRRNSFLKFLLLFLLTTGTIITAIFFNFKVPAKENALLKEQSKMVKKEMDFQSKFSKEMFEVKSLFDSLEVAGSNRTFNNSLISSKLVEMQKSIPTKDSTFRYDMYTRIVDLQVELQNTKKNLHELRDAEEKIKEYKELLDKCLDEYKDLQRHNALLNSRSN
tara:strand:- start:55385 stop:55894 length:510 start_codon:yes stop_codon:yes gene_type:complete